MIRSARTNFVFQMHNKVYKYSHWNAQIVYFWQVCWVPSFQCDQGQVSIKFDEILLEYLHRRLVFVIFLQRAGITPFVLESRAITVKNGESAICIKRAPMPHDTHSHTITHSVNTMFKAFTIILAASVVSAAPTRGQVAKLGSFNKLQERGDATYYNPSDPNQNHGYVNMGSCGPITDESIMVALSPSLGEMCGSCVSIRYGSNCVNAIVQDKCASCAPDHIDVTPAVFSQLAPLEAGIIKVDWDFSCSCPGGNIAQNQAQCTASNDFTQCSTGCCHEGQCAASEVCFGY
jgi:hypothetical protein